MPAILNAEPMLNAAAKSAPLNQIAVEAINRHPHLRNRKLRLEAHEGRVVLRGVVGSYYQKLLAQEALRNLEGVNEIQNDLEVSW